MRIKFNKETDLIRTSKLSNYKLKNKYIFLK